MTLEEIKRRLEKLENEYTDFINGYFQNWEVWGDASERVYQGEDVSEDEIPKAFHTEMKMMKMILKMEKSGDFDWNNPVVKKMFSEFSQSPFYTYFGETVVNIAHRIAEAIGCKSMLEIGAGNGNLTRKMMKLMSDGGKNIPLLITDSKDIVLSQEDEIREEFPSANIKSEMWNITESPSEEMKSFLEKPTLCYERYTVTYTSPEVIGNIAPLADVLVMGDWLSNSGKVFGYDKVFVKIGAKIILYDDVKRELDKYYSDYYFFDRRAQESIKSPYTGLLVAFKEGVLS